MNKKLTDDDIHTLQRTFALLFSGKHLCNPHKPRNNDPKKRGHKFKFIDFYKFYGSIYHVHWKTIERLVLNI